MLGIEHRESLRLLDTAFESVRTFTNETGTGTN
jgi:hypothetical protein